MDVETFEARKNGIGASEAAIILGLSEYENQTPLSVYLSKLPEAVPSGDTWPTMRGKAMEGAVLDLYEWKYNTPLIRGLKTEYSKKHPVIFATPDSIKVIDGTRVDAKTASARMTNKWGAEETDEVPTGYLVQMQVQMEVAEQTTSEIASFLMGLDDVRRYCINYDAELCEMIAAAAKEFMKRVENREPPDMVNSADVERLYRKSAAEAIVATPAIENMYRTLVEVSARRKKLTKVEEGLQFEIKRYLKDKDTLKIGDLDALTWKTSTDSKDFDEKLFKLEQPALYKQYTKIRLGSRRLNIKNITGELDDE
jgi:putative phage-type endonuclease